MNHKAKVGSFIAGSLFLLMIAFVYGFGFAMLAILFCALMAYIDPGDRLRDGNLKKDEDDE